MTNHADASRADALATASRNVEMAKENLRNQIERLRKLLREVDGGNPEGVEKNHCPAATPTFCWRVANHMCA